MIPRIAAAILGNWRNPIMIALAVVLLGNVFIVQPRLRGQRDTAQADAKAARAKTKLVIEQVRSATYQATFAAVFNAERVRLERAAIDERTVNALAVNRDAAVAGYQRLRSQAAALASAPRNPDLSAEREATCRAVAAAGCNEIPALLKAAQDNTDQLLALIAWAEAQAGIVTTAPAPKAP